MRTLRFWISLAAAAGVVMLAPSRPDAAAAGSGQAGAAAQPFTLTAGEHICIIGNQLAERLQYVGWLDPLLHARFPRHDLVIRNLGFSGDAVATRLHSQSFGTPYAWSSP